MDYLAEAKGLLFHACHGEGPESRGEGALLAIAQALVATCEELRKLNERSELLADRCHDCGAKPSENSNAEIPF